MVRTSTAESASTGAVATSLSRRASQRYSPFGEHAGFLTLELMREQGYYDPDKIREQVVFTTHTPVPAGHDYFEFGLIDRVFPTEALSTLKHMMPDVPGVSMTELGLKYSRYVNGVAKKHAEVSNAMFRMETVDWVTNGVHPTT